MSIAHTFTPHARYPLACVHCGKPESHFNHADVCIAGAPAVGGRCDDPACVCGGPHKDEPRLTHAGAVEAELSDAKAAGMYPVGHWWFDPTDNTLCKFDGRHIAEEIQLDESVRDRLMIPDILYDWTWCTDPRCGLTPEEHSGKPCEEEEDTNEPEPEKYLRLAYESWMKSQGLELASADEVLYGEASEKLTDVQAAWLTTFIAFWDQVTRIAVTLRTDLLYRDKGDSIAE